IAEASSVGHEFPGAVDARRPELRVRPDAAQRVATVVVLGLIARVEHRAVREILERYPHDDFAHERHERERNEQCCSSKHEVSYAGHAAKNRRSVRVGSSKRARACIVPMALPPSRWLTYTARSP